MNTNALPRLSRREVLAGGALVVAFALRPRGWAALAAPAKDAAPPLPGSLSKLPFLDGWVRVGADGRITIFSGKAELGQGIKTALVQVAAEELVVAMPRA
jgi:CO/xanthine dehydrogenase Mo-binding subunit